MSSRLRLLASASIALGLSVAVHPLSAQTLAYDGFGNGPLQDLAGSTGGTGWVSAWADVGTDTTLVAGPGLQYPGLASQPGAAVTPVAGGVWPSSIYQRTFQAPAVGTNVLYVSFLLRDDAAWGSWGGISFGQYPLKMTVGSPLGYYAYGLMVSEGLGDVSGKPLVVGETTLVVVKVSKNAPGTGITYRMYLDPVIRAPEPSFPDAAFTLAAVQSLPSAVSIDNGTGFTTDELRAGTSWASVLPAQAPIWIDLGFAKPGTFGAPHLAGSGPLTAGSRAAVTLTNARASALALLGIGTAAQYLPLLGGVLVPSPQISMAQVTDASGSAALQALWPHGVMPGQTVIFQYWIQDPVATFGFSASNGLQAISQ